MLHEDMDKLPLVDEPANIQLPEARLLTELCGGQTIEVRVDKKLGERDLELADDGRAPGRHVRDVDEETRRLLKLSSVVRRRSDFRGGGRVLYIARSPRSRSDSVLCR